MFDDIECYKNYKTVLHMQKEFYSVSDMAKLLDVNRQTIQTAIRFGRIQAFRVGIGKRSPYRIHHTEIERIQKIDFENVVNNLKDLMQKEK